MAIVGCDRRGAACCRDLQVEIMCTREEQELEALVRSRRSPYLCKIERPGDFSLEVEMISACGYLDDDGIACTLHGRRRSDGRRGCIPAVCSRRADGGRPRRPDGPKCAILRGLAVLMNDPTIPR